MRNILPIFPETSTLVLEFNFHVVFDLGSSAFYHLKAQQPPPQAKSGTTLFLNRAFLTTVFDPLILLKSIPRSEYLF